MGKMADYASHLFSRLIKSRGFMRYSCLPEWGTSATGHCTTIFEHPEGSVSVHYHWPVLAEGTTSCACLVECLISLPVTFEPLSEK